MLWKEAKQFHTFTSLLILTIKVFLAQQHDSFNKWDDGLLLGWLWCQNPEQC